MRLMLVGVVLLAGCGGSAGLEVDRYRITDTVLEESNSSACIPGQIHSLAEMRFDPVGGSVVWIEGATTTALELAGTIYASGEIETQQAPVNGPPTPLRFRRSIAFSADRRSFLGHAPFTSDAGCSGTLYSVGTRVR